MTFEQHTIATYGKSVYEIRLEVAMQWQANQSGYTDGTALTAWQMGGTALTAWQIADEFIEAMRARWQGKK